MWFSCVTVVGNQIFSNWWPFSLVMHCLPKHPQCSTHLFQLRTLFDQVLPFWTVQFITPVKGIQLTGRHCDQASLCTMPRVSRRNPACDGNWALQLFGSAKENVQYVRGVLDHVWRLGHEVKMIFQDQQTTIQAASAVVLHEDLLWREKMKFSTLDKTSQLKYVNKWKA